VIPSNAVLRTGQVVSFVPGDSAGDPGGFPPARRQQGLSSRSLLLPAGSPQGSARQGRCQGSREGISPRPRLCCPTGSSTSREVGEGWRGRQVPQWGAHPWEVLCQTRGYRAPQGVWRTWDGQGAGMFSDLPLLDQPPKGLRIQRRCVEAWWDTTCQPGS